MKRRQVLISAAIAATLLIAIGPPLRPFGLTISAHADDDGGLIGSGMVGSGIGARPPALTFLEDTTTLLANPFRGFQVTASGSELTKNDQTLGSFVTGEVTYRRHWEQLHTAASTYDFVALQDYFAKVRATNSTVNFRPVEYEPDSQLDCPTWLTATDGTYGETTSSDVTNATVNGAQSGAGTATGLTLNSGHGITSGQSVHFADGVTGGTVGRVITSVTATSISWTSVAQVSVSNGQAIIPTWRTCNWGNSNTRTAYGNMLNNLASYTLVGQLQTAFMNHPAWGAIDMTGWGAYGENHYSSSTINYVIGGIVSGGQGGVPTQTGLAVNTGHNIIVGDIVKFADAISGTTVTRNITAVAAGSITWASTTAVQVADLDRISRTGVQIGTTVNGGAEIPSVPADGATVPTPSTAAQQALVDLFPTYFTNNYFTHSVGLAGGPGLAYALGTKLYGWRGDWWGFRVNPAVCPGSGNQMCSLAPGELGYTTNSLDPSSAYHYARDNTGPVNLEPYSNFATWASTPYDRDQSFLWARQAGISSIETKNGWSQLNTWGSAATAFERQLGYRLYPSQVRKSAATIAAPNNLTLTTTWYNRGSAKFYAPNYYVMYKFVGPADTFRYATTTRPTWLPGTTNTVADVIPLPSWLNADTYNIFIGIGYDNATARPADHTRPSIKLAINPQPTNGTLWYPAGSVVVTNGAPTANPTYDYSAGMTAASAQFLLFTDNGSSSLDLAGTDFTVAARWYITDKTADRSIVSKGSPTSAVQNYTLYYKNSNDRLRFTVANGTTAYSVDDATLASPTASTWYCSIATFNNTTKEMLVRTNDGATSTATATGSIANTANNFRIGRDASANLWNGRIDAVRAWKRILTSAEQTLVCPSTNLRVRYEEMPQTLLEGAMVIAELDEATAATRNDAFQHWGYLDQASVVQAAS